MKYVPSKMLAYFTPKTGELRFYGGTCYLQENKNCRINSNNCNECIPDNYLITFFEKKYTVLKRGVVFLKKEEEI